MFQAIIDFNYGWILIKPAAFWTLNNSSVDGKYSIAYPVRGKCLLRFLLAMMMMIMTQCCAVAMVTKFPQSWRHEFAKSLFPSSISVPHPITCSSNTHRHTAKGANSLLAAAPADTRSTVAYRNDCLCFYEATSWNDWRIVCVEWHKNIQKNLSS